MEEMFTVEEIRIYIESKDSRGDILYYLNANNIKKANEEFRKAEGGKNEDSDVG